LANIFDAHPNVNLYMEPFAYYAGLFPGFPDRNMYLDKISNGLIELVHQGYDRFYQTKYPLFYKPNRSLILKEIDQILMNTYHGIARVCRLPSSQKREQYRLLNLNTLFRRMREQSDKHFTQPVEVIKELRLNFKVSLLAKCFPNAACLVITRHPGAQITSITKLFRQGGLGELEQSLASFVEDMNAINRFERYRNPMAEYDCSDGETRLVFWWLINYMTLIEDLDREGLPYRVVAHEDISQDPFRVVKELFDWSGLDLDSQVVEYIRLSSTTSERKGKVDPLDTHRQSADYVRTVIDNIDQSLAEKVRGVLRHVNRDKKLEPPLERYLLE
jgi:hypothetical protein